MPDNTWHCNIEKTREQKLLLLDIVHELRARQKFRSITIKTLSHIKVDADGDLSFRNIICV
jgi:hypothetical protein